MKARVHVFVLLAISATMIIVAAGNNLVFADPCTATLGYPATPVVYNNSYASFTVPVSATCTTYYQNQLYATGNAYDLTTNTGLGSTSTLLTSSSGGTEFNGQLSFNLQPSTQADSIQISVSLYSSQYGNLITETSETVQPSATIQQTTTVTVTEGQYPYANEYAYSNPYGNPSSPPFPYQPSPSHSHHPSQAYYQAQALTQTQNSTNILDYVVIIAIIATVIIATAGLVLVARRQPNWPQTQSR